MFRKNNLTVNNLPKYAMEYNYWVVTLVDNEFWFYGAYNEMTEAVNAAVEVGGYTCR